MDVKKFQLAMRPKKYLTHDFIIYRDPRLSQQEARSEMQAGGVVQREGFDNGGRGKKLETYGGLTSTQMDTARLENAAFEITKRNELGILSRAEDIAEVTGINKTVINKYIRENKLPNFITKEEAVKKYIDNALLNNKPLSEFKNKTIYDYLNNSLPEGSKGRVGQKEIERFLKKNHSDLWENLYAKKTGAMDFIAQNERVGNIGVNDFLKDPELIRNQIYIENLSLGAKRDELRILNAKLKLGAKDFAISQAQDRLVDDLNRAIRENPSIVLDNPKLMELASARVNSKTGELMIGVRDENKIKADIDKGFFSKEHLNPKGGEKMNVEFPTNKILVPRTTNESLIRSVQSYVKNNPEATLSDEILNFINHHGFNIRTEAGQTLGPKVGSTIENGKLGSFARQLESYGVDTSNFNLDVPDITKQQLTELKKPLIIRKEQLDKIIQSQFKEDPALKRLASAEFKDVCGLANGGRVGFKVGGPGESFDDCIARNFSEALGDAKNIEKNPKQGLKALNKLNNMMVKGASAGKTALRGLQAVLIGTGVGEIALTAVLEGLGPIEGMAEGEDWRRSLARSPLLGFALSKINPESFSEENLKKIVYGSGLEGEQLKGAEKVVSQFNRLNRIQDLYRQRESVEDYIQQLIDEGGDPTAIRNSMQGRFAEIDAQLDKEHEEFGKSENLIKRDDVVFLKRGIENYVSEQADKIGSSYLGKTATSGYGAMEDQPYIMEESAFVGDEFYPTKSREQIKAELRKKHAEEILEDRFGYGPMTQIQQDVAGFGKENISLADLFKYDTNAIIGYAEGGVVERKGFADGPKITRRGFIGAFAALIASLKMGSFGKTGKRITTEAGKKVLKDAPKGTPDWFAPLVDKVFREGVDAGETMKTVTGRETVKKLEVPAPGSDGAITDKYYVYHNPDTGEIRVDIDAPGIGANGEEFSLYMKPNRIDGVTDDGLPMIDEGEFAVIEQRAMGRMDGPDDYTMELDQTVVGLDDSASNWHAVEEFATGKTNKKAEAEQLKKKDYIEKNPAEDIENRYGPFDDTPPDDNY